MRTRRSIIVLICVIAAIIINVIAFADFFIAKVPDILLGREDELPGALNNCNNTPKYTTNNYYNNTSYNTITIINNTSGQPYERSPRINHLVLSDGEKDVSDGWKDDDNSIRYVSSNISFICLFL